MAPSLFSSGTTTPASGAEIVLISPGSSGTYVFIIDTANMAAGDSITLKIYYKVLSGGTANHTYITFVLTGVQADPIWISDPMPTDLSESTVESFTLTQTAGSYRAFSWKVITL